MFRFKKTLMPISLLVFPSTACIGGVDTVRITTDPAGADLYYVDYERDPVTDLRNTPVVTPVRSYAGKTPVSVAAPWVVPWLFSPGGLGGQKRFKVIIEKAGYPVITEPIPSRGRHCVGVQKGPQITERIFCGRRHLVSVRRGSQFGWGNTYEYAFNLEDYREEVLIDFRQACRLLKVSPVIALPWMKDGRFPKPVSPPRDNRSAAGALWRRADIEAWDPEEQLRPNRSDE